MAGKSIEKYVVMASGKSGGKTHVWTVAVFNSVKDARPWVALLSLARKSGDAETVKTMDVHAPELAADATFSEVKYSGRVVQYGPEASGLSDDATLG